MAMPRVWIGCSGFNYAHWKKVFYPEGLPQKKWLEYYSTIFSTVELNVTFYRLPKESSFDLWYNETPPDFIFSVKGSRYISHIKKMLDASGPLELFFKGALRLREKLGVVLWQFPPSFRIELDRFNDFLNLLQPYRVRSAFEFRNETWITDEVISLCRQRNVALCTADWPPFVDALKPTADFVYIRRHGAAGAYQGCYSSDYLKSDSRTIRSYAGKGMDVYLYFNNDAKGCAPANARELMSMRGMNRKGGNKSRKLSPVV